MEYLFWIGSYVLIGVIVAIISKWIRFSLLGHIPCYNYCDLLSEDAITYLTILSWPIVVPAEIICFCGGYIDSYFTKLFTRG